MSIWHVHNDIIVSTNPNFSPVEIRVYDHVSPEFFYTLVPHMGFEWCKVYDCMTVYPDYFTPHLRSLVFDPLPSKTFSSTTTTKPTTL
jgi:hypothetical protein